MCYINDQVSWNLIWMHFHYVSKAIKKSFAKTGNLVFIRLPYWPMNIEQHNAGTPTSSRPDLKNCNWVRDRKISIYLHPLFYTFPVNYHPLGVGFWCKLVVSHQCNGVCYFKKETCGINDTPVFVLQVTSVLCLTFTWAPSHEICHQNTRP